MCRPEGCVLTRRERDVLNLVASGKTIKEVAAVLSISPATVAVHRKRVCGKLGVHSTAELVACAVARLCGMIEEARAATNLLAWSVIALAVVSAQRASRIRERELEIDAVIFAVGGFRGR